MWSGPRGKGLIQLKKKLTIVNSIPAELFTSAWSQRTGTGKH